MKKVIIILCVVFFAWAAINRVVQIRREAAREVFNIARFVEVYGLPVETMTARVETRVLNVPVAVRGGIIPVASTRVSEFRQGLSLTSGGSILSVPRRVDLDTGLFSVRASGPDGNYFMEVPHTGVFVPLYAVLDGLVMLLVNGYSVEREVNIIAQDRQYAAVSGISDGDIIIITRVAPQIKINNVVQR
ncbi:MAG: hypothetical protein FWC85_00540 [Elusimicrobia bacterium]|nr:hypothetical protein [Elusimicrobiota bacterium]